MEHSCQAESRRSQLYRTVSGGIAAEVNVVCQASHHRAYFNEAFSSLPISLLGVVDGFGRKMDSLFEQARGIRLDRPTLGCGLAGELNLTLGSDVNSDRQCGGLLSKPCPHPTP